MAKFLFSFTRKNILHYFHCFKSISVSQLWDMNNAGNSSLLLHWEVRSSYCYCQPVFTAARQLQVAFNSCQELHSWRVRKLFIPCSPCPSSLRGWKVLRGLFWNIRCLGDALWWKCCTAVKLLFIIRKSKSKYMVVWATWAITASESFSFVEI